mgnify:FL=1
MKIETKLALKKMLENKKRSIFTCISLILCSTLILTTIILISSIKNGVSESFNSEYNDYHFILKNLSPERFEKIKDKPYIDKIYIQKNKNAQLEKIDAKYVPTGNVTLYLKYNNIKDVCNYSNDIIAEMNYTKDEIETLSSCCEFNKQLLTVNGFIDVTPTIKKDGTPDCKMKMNYSYIINLMIIVTIGAFSILFIIILYNAFLITINERKREYAVLNSVGGTEGQVLKMIFTEAVFMGSIGIIAGFVFATFISSSILGSVNSILNSAGYYFKLTISAKYMVLAILLIIINIYLSVLIPSIKASSTSVIQGIRNNKQIKYKGKNSILEKTLPIEGKLAIKNIKRNKSKYRLITLLLIISITSFIAMSTYLKYEKETADIATEYDVDAGFWATYKDYETILKEYERKYNKKLEIIKYHILWNEDFLVEPTDAVLENTFCSKNIDNTKSVRIRIIALEDTEYSKYIKEVNGKYGDFIIYNTINISTREENENKYEYVSAFKENSNLKLKLVDVIVLADFITDYNIIDESILNGKYILTDKIVDGFKEVKNDSIPTLFMNVETFERLDKYINETSEDIFKRTFWLYNDDTLHIKIKCDNIIEFKNYIDEVNKSREDKIWIDYYTLENQEKLIYINIVELLLRTIMIAIITIGIASTINIMNASLCERKEDFKILHRIGATKKDIRKILVYETVVMFIKATIISAIISVPIIWGIIKHMENVITLNKILVPFGSIGIYLAIMLVIMLIITAYSSKTIKIESN